MPEILSVVPSCINPNTGGGTVGSGNQPDNVLSCGTNSPSVQWIAIITVVVLGGITGAPEILSVVTSNIKKSANIIIIIIPL